MTFVSGNSVLGCSDTSVNKVSVDIQSTTDRVNDFEHNTVLSVEFEEADID